MGTHGLSHLMLKTGMIQDIHIHILSVDAIDYARWMGHSQIKLDRCFPV